MKYLKINALVVLGLFLGFIVSIIVPRIAISKVGTEIYGLYGLIVGFGGILSFSDLGTLPGIIKALSKPIATNRRNIGKRSRVNIFGHIFTNTSVWTKNRALLSEAEKNSVDYCSTWVSHQPHFLFQSG